MRSFFKRMDTLKWIITGSLVAGFALGVWHLVLRSRYARSLAAFEQAKRDVVRIHSELQQIRVFLAAKRDAERTGEMLDPGVFFATQLTKRAGIDINDYQIKPIKEKGVKIKSGHATKNAVDKEVEIDFKVRRRNQIRPIPRENLFVALFNCEASSRRWKLRELKIRAKEDQKRPGRGVRAYPAELSDEWIVEKLVFVAREPKR